MHFNDPSTVTTDIDTDKKYLGQRTMFTGTSPSSFSTSSAFYATLLGLRTFVPKEIEYSFNT